MLLAKQIVNFLGYLPRQESVTTIGKQLYFARIVFGHTQEQAAIKMGCNKYTIQQIELEKGSPQRRTLKIIMEYVSLAKSKL